MPVRNITEMGAESIDLSDHSEYTLAEAARYLNLATATLRSWVIGRTYPKANEVARFVPLIPQCFIQLPHYADQC